MKKAFTMIELVFVIVVIGILAGVAIPKFAATRDDAIISKARATVGALRSAIATERQKQILRGNFADLNGSAAAGLLDPTFTIEHYPRWSISEDGNTFTFTAPDSSTCAFTVSSNKLTKGTCSVSGMSDL
jgi:general secretion pathway protein G